MLLIVLCFSQSSGDKALYVWRPVPPSSVFVALGMIATTTDAPPPQDSVRCVPRRWVVESTFKPVKVGVILTLVDNSYHPIGNVCDLI